MAIKRGDRIATPWGSAIAAGNHTRGGRIRIRTGRGGYVKLTEFTPTA